MSEFDKDQIDAIRTWYSEWVKIPTYLTSASLGFLAFSLTNLIPHAQISTVFIRTAWILLGLSAVFACVGLLSAYCSLDIGIRLYLSRNIREFNLKAPAPNTPWIRRWGRGSFYSTGLAIPCLLSAQFV